MLILIFYEHLKKSFSKSNIDVIIFNSPVITKLGKRGHYRYSLIGKGSWRDLAIEETLQTELEDDNREMNREEFEKQQEENKKTGELGEKLINKYLLSCKKDGLIADFFWKSETTPNAPYDFHLTENDKSETFIDVKSTRKSFGTLLYISWAELKKMEGSKKYLIYRVYDLTETEGKLRISENLVELASEILQQADDFLKGYF